MKSNTVIWWLISAFFLAMAVVYLGWHLVIHWDALSAGEITFTKAVEWTGFIPLLFGVFMAGMVAFFLGRWHGSQKGVELAADRLDADIDDDDPELGEFSPWSWWPLALGAAAALGALALAVGIFILPFAVALLVVSLVGWVYEYYRGNFAR
ncbi:aa3-type cytochrome oxidase subunit IV [Microbacterium halophytorum]|uniref:aa3-type cytochrome oxidase subunit IV n=1 Tax=Microbacterium halophytorum TaxID=2067568 RepID=UPI000CFAF8E1|nr:cytochrome c oxidase subunit 4 [Microbacterium halophytorum]